MYSNFILFIIYIIGYLHVHQSVDDKLEGNKYINLHSEFNRI